ncbi:unnamed protein product [Acanthoscelides obtectus]|uniref:Uncharacterized protein n=1 Tax=Acanthoscelides obtectus TaxID=200917 RepID=A0A9P0M7Q0_ACAOB|nr:unnamed protein product [Acanthoscelides obtectus]CAK1667120.1 Zinc finger protein 648 [Acanthoscelides obtectus]
MTMFTLPNFCRVCLKYDKNLIDLAHIENEPNETLMSKLQHTVSEVEWAAFKPLLCHPCIKRLNIAYGFKKQCVQSAAVLKNYVELVKESQRKNESPNLQAGKSDGLQSPGGTYMLLPNQKYVKIMVGGQNQLTNNSFQNVFLNLIPTAALNNPVPPLVPQTDPGKDTNQNVFLSLNNTFQKFIPGLVPTQTSIQPLLEPKQKSSSVNEILSVGKSEEVSVEVDPSIFGLAEEADDRTEDDVNDYDEVISQAKITLKDFNVNGESIQNGNDQKYVPILPKSQDDFFTSGQHFLFSSSSENGGANGIYPCEQCQKSFPTKKTLKHHFNQFHLGKLPFKCEICYSEFLTRPEYDACIQAHRDDNDMVNQSITLQDLETNYQPSLTLADVEANVQMTENGEYVCDVCRRIFNSPTGLLRHKVRKHGRPKTRKKYFIKGMKNARCDICNRDFSTQSYMQLHRKLHERDDIGYKYKVFGKSRYKSEERYEKEEDENSKQEQKQDGKREGSYDGVKKEKTDDERSIDGVRNEKMEVEEEEDEENSDEENSNQGDNNSNHDDSSTNSKDL